MAINETMQKIALLGLYEQIEFEGNVLAVIRDYLNNQQYNDLSIDLYCPSCNMMSTFNPTDERQLIESRSMDYYYAFVNGKINFLVIHFRCARDKTHYFCVQLLLEGKYITKIGQYPSRASIDIPEVNKFRKILSEEKLNDLKRAIGLFSHGIGAGAFVYLRRVYEYLIYEAKEEAKQNGDIDINLYEKSRMTEKIDLLKNYLPVFLVKNKFAYGILSKGVHELSEDECLAAFNLLEETIELILQEKLEKHEKKIMEEDLEKNISKLNIKMANGT